MPSDGSGNFSLVAGYLAVTGETIQASQHNPPLEDIASGMTDRLMRSGVAPMTGQLKGHVGSVSLPGYSFSGSPTFGFYKTTDGIGLAISGVLVAEWTAAGQVSGIVTASIPDAAVTLAKLANLAEKRVIGRNTTGSGVPEAVTAAQVLEWISASMARGDILLRGASAFDRLAIGAAGSVLKSDGTDAAWGSPALQLFHAREEQSQGTNSQSATTTGSWITTVVNTEKTNEISGASLASNEITLPAGTYEIEAFVPLYQTFSGGSNSAKARLFDQTNTAVLLYGTHASAGSASSANASLVSVIRGRFTLAGSAALRIQHYKTAANVPVAFSQGTEVYTDVMIRKIP